MAERRLFDRGSDPVPTIVRRPDQHQVGMFSTRLERSKIGLFIDEKSFFVLPTTLNPRTSWVPVITVTLAVLFLAAVLFHL